MGRGVKCSVRGPDGNRIGIGGGFGLSVGGRVGWRWCGGFGGGGGCKAGRGVGNGDVVLRKGKEVGPLGRG